MPTILVIDDEAPVRTLLRTVLERLGYDVREASNGRAALALCRVQAIDLVITDIFMPDLNGLETISRLTHEFLNVKVIAITGAQGDPHMLEQARLLGARHTLVKPFSLPQLVSTVSYELALTDSLLPGDLLHDTTCE
ncbi:response regulator [Nitrospira sp. KM1]|uniref:response regulator n=1 Tax=Nitrospira sp. KM1 TaxID=1936990 RepID=UPI0013A781CA|nr:response regulator [Nitrospira sp. KM1]BCA56070.1 response regulator [Nitrospira sp. KM1]